MPRWLENLVCGLLLGVVVYGVGVAIFGALRADRFDVTPSDAVIGASNDSPRCFDLPPMCSGSARPVCICGFYSVTCRWECAQ